jgi:2,3-bisphosphoglycerate-independent phosphoglycerate mutase
MLFLEAVQHLNKNNSALHLLGLVSGGGVHSFDEHLYALLGLASENKIDKVFIHMFTDGRDTGERAVSETLRKLRLHIEESQIGEIATIVGRFYAMDRGGHWDQTVKTFNMLVKGQGEYALSAEEAVNQSYQSQIFDEMISPTVIVKNMETKEPVATIADNDAVVFINFRSDRALQLAQFFTYPQAVPEPFRQPLLQNLFFVTMTEYDKNLPVHVAFPTMDLKNNLAEVLSQKNYTQFHIAESEKYAHITVFFNCGQSEKFPGEERVIVTSPDNARNYVDSPGMSAEELTDILTKKIQDSDTNFFIANFANCDIVGHTGNLRASVKAVEFIDMCLKKIKDAALQTNAALIVTADHGNVEQMINVKTREIDKDHTANPVPFLLVGKDFKLAAPNTGGFMSLAAQVPSGVVSDIAPTILALYGIGKPEEMTGINLLDTLEVKDVQITP